MQLRELDLASDKLRQQGVAVHLITAEPGGDEEVKRRLSDRNASVGIPVHSDPEHKLLLPGSHSLYIQKEFPASKFGGTYEDYTLVQPALVVVHKSGEIQQAWSWNTGVLGQLQDKGEMTPVSSCGGAILASVRPISSDIGASIQEGRAVRLKGMRIHWIISEKINLPAMFKMAKARLRLAG